MAFNGADHRQCGVVDQMSFPNVSQSEDELWNDIINALASGSELYKAAFTQLQGSADPFQTAMAVVTALPPGLRKRSQLILRTWASRETACQKQMQHQRAAAPCARPVETFNPNVVSQQQERQHNGTTVMQASSSHSHNQYDCNKDPQLELVRPEHSDIQQHLYEQVSHPHISDIAQNNDQRENEIEPRQGGSLGQASMGIGTMVRSQCNWDIEPNVNGNISLNSKRKRQYVNSNAKKVDASVTGPYLHERDHNINSGMQHRDRTSWIESFGDTERRNSNRFDFIGSKRGERYDEVGIERKRWKLGQQYDQQGRQEQSPINCIRGLSARSHNSCLSQRVGSRSGGSSIDQGESISWYRRRLATSDAMNGERNIVDSKAVLRTSNSNRLQSRHSCRDSDKRRTFRDTADDEVRNSESNNDDFSGDIDGEIRSFATGINIPIDWQMQVKKLKISQDRPRGNRENASARVSSTLTKLRVKLEPHAVKAGKKNIRGSGVKKENGHEDNNVGQYADESATESEGEYESDMDTCLHPSGCRRSRKGNTTGMCHAHGGHKKCKHSSECGKQAQWKSMCATHGGVRICTFKDRCELQVYRKALCRMHGRLSEHCQHSMIAEVEAAQNEHDQTSGGAEKCVHHSGCHRSGKGNTCGMCLTHGGKKQCRHSSGCGKHAKLKGMCATHGGVRICKFQDGCELQVYRLGFCKKHGRASKSIQKSAVAESGTAQTLGTTHKCVHPSGCHRSGKGNTKGMCKAHGGKKQCIHPSGCGKQAKRKGMCISHGGVQKCEFVGAARN